MTWQNDLESSPRSRRNVALALRQHLWIGLVLLLLLGASGYFLWKGFAPSRQPPGAEFRALQSAAQGAGATKLALKQLPDGGVLMDGLLAGRQFSARFPAAWNHQGAVFAHGYSTPGSPIAIAADPFTQDVVGLFHHIYGRKFAIAESAFDKSGMGVESGAYNTLRLKQFLDRLGATRVYLAGASMGGNITLALIEQHPHTFAGALSACGVVDGWSSEIGYLIDVRASYNYFTQGTKYELPGNKDLLHDAISPEPPRLLRFAATPYRLIQLKRISSPVLALFQAAAQHPGGLEDHIIQNVAAASSAPAEVASFLYPLVTIGLGMDDLNQTYAGVVAGNDHRVYQVPYFSTEDNAALNQSIQRIHADPQAVARAAVWHQSTGVFDTPLITIHNQIDSLVPYAQEEGLRAAVERSGNQANLLQRAVPPMTVEIPGTGVKGTAHCGFTPAQAASAWDDLETWVESSQKPQ